MTKTKRLTIEANVEGKQLNDREFVAGFLKDLAQRIDMEPLAGPFIAEGRKIPGLTGALLIETSHIIVHHYTDPEKSNRTRVVLDIYSIKEFDGHDVKKYMNKHYGHLSNVEIFLR